MRRRPRDRALPTLSSSRREEAEEDEEEETTTGSLRGAPDA